MNDLNLYFQCCSITINCQIGSIIAATLANNGVCPTTGDNIFKRSTIKDCLSLMYNCGMYDYSGQFAFSVGLPAKSGVSGAILLIVPGKYGICIYSPRLDKNGNSTRGVEVCKRISKDLGVHIFHNMVTEPPKK
jgi:glutaminase